MSVTERMNEERWIWGGLLLSIALIVIAGGWIYYRQESGNLRRQKYQELKSIAELKANEIGQWRVEWKKHAASIAANPFIQEALTGWKVSPVERVRMEEALRSVMVLEREAIQCRDIRLLNTLGRVLVSTRTPAQPVEPEEAGLLWSVLDHGVAVEGDLYRDTPGGEIRMDVMVPVWGGGIGVTGVLEVEIRAEDYLFPLIQSWPAPSETAETLLVRREGGEVLFLNDLRQRAGAALTLRFPLTRTDLPAVRAVLGATGMFEGLDYRGKRVVADLRAVPGTGWFMVTKVDREEILGEVRYRAAVIAIVAGLLILLAWAWVAFLYRRRQASLYEELLLVEQKKREAQEEYRITLYSIGDAVITTGLDGRVTRMNPVAERLTARTATEAVGRPLGEIFVIINEETRAPAENPVDRALREGTVVALADHTMLLARDGIERPIGASAATIRDSERAITGAVIVFQDQSRERAHRRTLVESEAKLREAQAIAGVGSYEFDLSTGRWVGSEVLDAIFGIDPAYERTVEGWLRLTHPDDRETMGRYFVQLAGKTAFFDKEFRILRPDGKERWVHGRGRIIRGEGERPVLLKGTIQDVTERKQAEERMLFINKAVESSREAIGISDAQGHHIYQNRALSDLFGYATAEELESAGGGPAVVRDPEVAKEMFEAIMGGRSWSGELEMLTKAGRVFSAYERADAIKNVEGKLVGLIGIVTDITERKEREKQLLHIHQLMSYIIEHMQSAVAVHDREMRYVYVSQRYLQDYNVKEENIIGKHHYDVFPDLPQKWRDVHQRVLAGEVMSAEDDPFERADGTLEWTRWECRPWYEADGSIGGLIVYTEVITDRKQREEIIKRSLLEKEVLLKEIHHRVKNNMQVIASLLDLQADGVSDGQTIQVFQESRNRIRVMAMVHERLYQSADLAHVSLTEYLEGLARYLAGIYGRADLPVDLSFDFDPITLGIDDAILCGLIVNELISNAFKYAFRERPPGAPGPRIWLGVRRLDDGLELRVADNGSGLPPGLDIRQASTLGLKLVGLLARQLRGFLEVERDQGTAVRVRFHPEPLEVVKEDRA